jgi:hypothetical protein
MKKLTVKPVKKTKANGTTSGLKKLLKNELSNKNNGSLVKTASPS